MALEALHRKVSRPVLANAARQTKEIERGEEFDVGTLVRVSPGVVMVNGASEMHYEVSGDASEMVQRAKRQRREKSVSDTIMIAFHAACDLRDFEIAKRLLEIFESAILAASVTPGFDRRRALGVLVAGHERLWHLRHH